MAFSRNNRYVICDVCGGRFHRKDTVIVSDKYNRQYGLLVCKYDVDKTNPQSRPFTFTETILTVPEKVRPRQPMSTVPNEYDDRVPGKPTNGRTEVDPLDNVVNLFWDAPTDNGSSAIIGYRITRANPQLSYQFTIEDNTGTASTFYRDATSDVNLDYSYQVAAINSFGIGPYSDFFYWPVAEYPYEDVLYIGDNEYNVIADDDGNLLVDNYPT